MAKTVKQPEDPSPVEMAVVAKWALHEAWLYCMEILDDRYEKGKIKLEEKDRLKEKHTAFFEKAFYTEIKTSTDIDNLVKHARKMLAVLERLDRKTWMKFILDNGIDF